MSEIPTQNGNFKCHCGESFEFEDDLQVHQVSLGFVFHFFLHLLFSLLSVPLNKILRIQVMTTMILLASCLHVCNYCLFVVMS